MNIQGNIGWINVCRTDPSKSYEIGGSEEVSGAANLESGE